MPTNRQLALVKDPNSLSCAIGWFATPERMEYAKFTKAILPRQGWMLLANADFARAASPASAS
jgi:hypothetical protein